jgi:uncharacterized membrane protein HdeD (DUF308 family)
MSLNQADSNRPRPFDPKAPLSPLDTGGFAGDDMSAVLARNWWAIALRGLFAILFGLVAVFLPGVTLASLVLLFGAYMVVDGIFDIVAAVRTAQQHNRWGWLLVEGIADLAAGAIAFVWPLATILAFVILMAAWAIVSGAMMGAAAFRLRHSHGRWLMLIGGVVSVLWGVLLFLFPILGAVVLTLWMGAYALFFGVTLLALAFQLRRRQRAMDGAPAHAPG